MKWLHDSAVVWRVNVSDEEGTQSEVIAIREIQLPPGKNASPHHFASSESRLRHLARSRRIERRDRSELVACEGSLVLQVLNWIHCRENDGNGSPTPRENNERLQVFGGPPCNGAIGSWGTEIDMDLPSNVAGQDGRQQKGSRNSWREVKGSEVVSE